MKNTILIIISIIIFSCSGQKKPQKTYVPDDNFERALQRQGYDTGELDDYVLSENIKEVTSLNVWRDSIKDLTGIEGFVALTELSCYDNQLSHLDVSKNTALTRLNCSSNQLTSLDVSKNTALTRLECSSNQLTHLDISKNTALKILWYDNNTVLTELKCSRKQLAYLNISDNTPLIIVDTDDTKEVEKTESLDSIYILEKEPDISIGMESLPFEPDFAYVANNSLFFGEKENLTSKKIPIKGEVLSFTYAPNGQYIYFALKTNVNEITKKQIDKLEEQGYGIEAYDLKIYKFDIKKPSKAEYVTTLYDRTSAFPEGSYFLTYGKPDFNITCSGDILIVYCEPQGGEGGFSSKYVVSLADRKTSWHNWDNNKSFKCTFPEEADLLDHRQLKFKFSGDNMKVFREEELDVLIFNHNSWTSLFGKEPDIISRIKTFNSYSSYFDFSISPDYEKIVYSAFTLGDMDIRTGSTYIYNSKDSTSFTISNKVVLGNWYDGEHRWLSNSNLLLYCSKCNGLLLINTKDNEVNKIEHVSFFQVAPF